MVLIFNAIIALVVGLSAVEAVDVHGHKMVFGHTFPAHTDRGLPTANEFQMIHPENIKDGRLKADSDFSFVDISPLMINNDDVVTVQFSSNKPTAKEWIAAYSPANVDITTTTPVKYGWCDDDAGYLSTGKGALTFNMTNLRADIAFYYFTNSTAHPVLVATSESKVSFNNFNEPLRPRIVATGDPNVFNLLWSSATSQKPVLRWGVAPGKYTNSVQAETSTIPKSELCGAPANTIGWRDLGLIHTASFVGMKALSNTKIYYSFGDDATNDFSKEFIMFTPPQAGTQPPNRPTRVILFDDLGRGSTDMTYTWNEYGRPSVYTSMAVGAEIQAGNVDAIYHGGDISYATGYLSVWDFYLDMQVPMAGSVLYLTTVGNHESDWTNSASLYSNTDSGGECGVATTRLIPMPAPATTDKPWWSYDVGLMHMVGMSTEHNFTVGSEQYLWLENDLKSVNRTITPWIIFGGHRAMYLNSNYGGTVTSDITVMDELILNIEPLLWTYRVNFGFYGHNHVVQRHAAVLNKQVVQHAVKTTDASGNTIFKHDNPQATVHMVIGTGGAAFTVNYVSPYPDWNELVFYQWGYARLTAVNASYLDLEWVDSQSHEIVDHLVITQEDPNRPWVV